MQKREQDAVSDKEMGQKYKNGNNHEKSVWSAQKYSEYEFNLLEKCIKVWTALTQYYSVPMVYFLKLKHKLKHCNKARKLRQQQRKKRQSASFTRGP